MKILDLIGTFCIVNPSINSVKAPSSQYLIGTFCIVNEHRKYKEGHNKNI